MKNRAISDKIDAVFRFREEELRKLAPLWGGDTLTQEEYVSISGILSAVHSYFLAKESEKNPSRLIIHNLTLATIVILITFFVGKLISIYLN